MAYYVKFVRGTQDAYNALVHKSLDTLYFITEADEAAGKLYLGETLIAQGSQNEVLAIDQLSDVNISTPLDESHMLVWQFDKDEQGNKLSTGHWVNKTYTEIIGYPTRYESENGNGYTNGLVPPSTEAQASGDYFLAADGTWKQISVSGDISLEKTKVYEISAIVSDNHENKIAEAVGGNILNTGDIAIVKVTLVADSNSADEVDDGKYQYTAYVYSDNKWKAMDGNYSANNVYTTEDITVTTAVGELAVNKVIAAGTNMGDLLTSMLSQSKDPSITRNPSVSAFSVKSNDETSFEAGTTITPVWNSTFSSGSYTYKSTASKETITPVSGTGVTVSSWSIKAKEGTNDAVEIGASEDGTGSSYILGDSNVVYTATATYSDGNYALTNLNKLPKTDVRISGNSTTSSSATISTYRKMFAGGIVDSSSEIDSALIRSLSTGVQATTIATEFKAVVGDSKLLFAYPTTLSTKTPTFEYFTMSWEGFSGFALEGTVEVADVRGGENGKITYNLYSYTPAAAFKADTQFRVSFN